MLNNKDNWKKISQKYELDFHKSKHSDWRWDDRWLTACDILQKYFNLNFNKYYGKTLLDVGAGPRTMMEWWECDKKIAIEPLANEYAKIRNNALCGADIIHNAPAEDFIPELENSIDFIWCLNCLDHCYDWEKILDNINKYLKIGGEFYIATDIDSKGDAGHFTIKKQDIINKLETFNWQIELQYDKKSIESMSDIDDEEWKAYDKWVRKFTIIGKKVKEDK